MIKIEQLSKDYCLNGQTLSALKNINLEVARGEIFGIIGPSGAGKSTLIRCVNLLEQPTLGRVSVDDQILTELSAQQLRQARRKISMIFQHFNLLSSRTVYENVSLPLALIGISKTEINNRVMPLLELTGLAARQNAYPSQLSGGQKQRVAIARALTNDPKVLLCDEATSALDPETTDSILQLLNQINQDMGLTILLITHEMGVIKTCCHRLGIIEHGALVEVASTIDFFGKPKSTVARRFIQEQLQAYLPPALKANFTPNAEPGKSVLWQIAFIGESASKPLIAHLLKEIGLEVNILHANIERIQRKTVGTMVLTASGDAEQVAKGQDYLGTHGIHVEVIGYV